LPEYTYIDANGHEAVLNNRMLYSTSVICSVCGGVMWRKPSRVIINWGGLKPSDGEPPHVVQNHIKNISEYRERINAKYDDRND